MLFLLQRYITSRLDVEYSDLTWTLVKKWKITTFFCLCSNGDELVLRNYCTYKLGTKNFRCQRIFFNFLVSPSRLTFAAPGSCEEWLY
jgi:hypothetical protein